MNKVLIDTYLYCKAIKSLRNSVSTDDARPPLKNIYFEVKGDKIEFSATDGYHGQIITVPLHKDTEEHEDFTGFITADVPVFIGKSKKKNFLIPVSLELSGNKLCVSYDDPQCAVSYFVYQSEDLRANLSKILRPVLDRTYEKEPVSITLSTSLLMKHIKSCAGASAITLYIDSPISPVKVVGEKKDYSLPEITFEGVILPIRMKD